ncbi:MAG: hypothetical protein K8H74_17280 [Notoacmeibacter sp.]|nr:hypothetical protein [Notoacmeibacter sp.]
MQDVQNDIDALIREEKRLSAIECHDEAWTAGLLAGIEPDIIAETAISTALSELQREMGEDAAAALLDRMRDKLLGGEFCPDTRRH